MPAGSRAMVIIGAGQAGAWAAQTLRSEGHDGPIILIGKERVLPYERPPLSKGILVDPSTWEQAILLPAAKAAKLGIKLRLGVEVMKIDRHDRRVVCDDGSLIDYDRLFLTTGSAPRWPVWAPPASLSYRVHALRTLDDAARLSLGLQTARKILIVGGGWIGLEVAASARKLGVDVEIFEAADRLCARSVPAEISQRLAAIHRENGVALHLSARIEKVVADASRATLQMADGAMVDADQILIGIGNMPATELAQSAGLEVANGVVVDSFGRTSDPHIFAAGDVTCFACAYAGGVTRRESWANAQNQAIAAARAALGKQVEYNELPWLWSDQYHFNIQIVGTPERARSTLFKPGAVAGEGSWLGLDQAGRAIGAVTLNAPREIRAARKLIQMQTPVEEGQWA